jgi:chorismate synthase
MSGNTFGRIFRLTTFGESHGAAIGGIIDGCPAGLELHLDTVRREMARRRPGQSALTTERDEEDGVEFLSGIFEGKTTGAPVAFSIKNRDQRSADYDELKNVFRPSHADFTYQEKYGIRDHRGGGRSSARETACRVAAGAVAKMLLARYGISVNAFVRQVGTVSLSEDYFSGDIETAETNDVRCPDPVKAREMDALISKVKSEGDSVGGVIQCLIKNLPVGLGEPVFDKFHAVMAHAMMSINAAKGFELGSGFDGAQLKGSQANDVFTSKEGKVQTVTNHSGGVQGGLTNGMPVYFNVAFKPVSTIARPQQTLTTQGKEVELKAAGRHDPCVVPRAVPIVEAMAALVVADFMLLSRCSRIA